MFTRVSRVAVVLGCCGAATAARGDVLVPTLPPPATPSEADTARATAAYTRAQEHYGKDELKAALADADEAYAALPNASTAIIRAIILGDLKRPREAFEAYLVALNLGVDEDQRPYIDEGLAEQGQAMQPPMGWVVVSAKPEGAAVQLAGTTFSAPMAVGVTAGFHKVSVFAENHQTTSAGFTAVAGIGQQLEYTLNPAAEKPPDPNGHTKVDLIHTDRPLQPGQVAGWVAIGAGAAAIAAGVGLHAWAADLRKDTVIYGAGPIEGMDEATRRTRWREASTDLQGAQVGAWILYGVGAVAAAAGVVLVVLGAPSDEGEPELTPGASPVEGGAVLWMRGRY